MLIAFCGTVLTILIGFTTGAIGATPALLVLVIFLLSYQTFRKRDFYVVEHILYDLNFIETPGSYGRPRVRVERGPMLAHGCRSVGFCDYAAAKASFDHQEASHRGDPLSGGSESIHRIYVVSAWRKPKSTLLKDDKYRQHTLLDQTPYPAMFADRKEAAEEHVLRIENEHANTTMISEMNDKNSQS